MGGFIGARFPHGSGRTDLLSIWASVPRKECMYFGHSCHENGTGSWKKQVTAYLQRCKRLVLKDDSSSF